MLLKLLLISPLFTLQKSFITILGNEVKVTMERVEWVEASGSYYNGNKVDGQGTMVLTWNMR